MKNLFLYFFVFTLISCSTTRMNKSVKLIDIQGHRGCRGLLPENTIIAFEKALDMGVTTLEMDLVISKEKLVIVSHEPFFNHEISTTPDGEAISAEDEHNHNIYQLGYDEIKKYDVGLKPHIRFPDQANQKASKPLFMDVVRTAEVHSKKIGRPLPYYNVEIKRRPDYDNLYHPDAKEFATLVVSTIQATGVKERIYIQSFDIESLKESEKIDPDIKSVLLIENEDAPLTNLNKLGFTPEVYSPYYKLVNSELVQLCQAKGIKLIPWTVNQIEDMEQMLEIGVDGIITDYPDILIRHIAELPGYDVLK